MQEAQSDIASPQLEFDLGRAQKTVATTPGIARELRRPFQGRACHSNIPTAACTVCRSLQLDRDSLVGSISSGCQMPDTPIGLAREHRGQRRVCRAPLRSTCRLIDR